MSVQLETGDFERAKALVDLRRFRDALPLFQRSVAGEPGSAERWCWLSLCLSRLDLDEQAKDAAERAIELDPDWEWPHRLRALALSGLGRSDATAAGREAVRNAPQRAVTHAQASFIATKVGAPDEALVEADEAVRLDPEHDPGWAAKGWAEMVLGRFEEAEESYLNALRLAPNESMWHNNYGVVLLSLGRHDDAATSFRTALEINPANGYADRNLARAVGFAGDLEASAKIHRHASENRLRRCDQALALAPHDPVGLAARAGMLAQFGRGQEARSEIARAVRRGGSTARVRALQAVVFEVLGERERAKTALLKAVRLDPGNGMHLINLARVYLRLGMARECRRIVDRLALSHTSPATQFEGRGYAAAVAGKWDEAIAALTHAVTLRPLDCCAHAWLGVARLESQDWTAAEWCLRRVRAIYPQCLSVDVLEHRLGDP